MIHIEAEISRIDVGQATASSKVPTRDDPIPEWNRWAVSPTALIVYPIASISHGALVRSGRIAVPATTIPSSNTSPIG